MAKRKVTTVEEMEMPEAPIATLETMEAIQPDSPESPALESSADAELCEFFENMASSASMIKVYKLEGGQQAYCGTFEPSALNEEVILQKWGGGTYLLRASKNGKWIANGYRRITLREPLGGLNKPYAAPETIQPPSQNGELNILRDQIAQQHNMLLALIEKSAGNSQAFGMKDMAAMIGLMQSIQPKQPDISAVFPSVMEIFTKSMEMAKDATGGGDGKTSWTDLAMVAVKKLPEMLQAVAGMKRGVLPAANPPEQEAQTMAMEAQIMAALGWLKQKALKGKDPLLLAEFLADNMDEYKDAAMSVLNTPLEQILSLDAELQREPLRTWFEQLYTRLKEAASDGNQQAISGQAGSGADIEPDEGADN